MDLKPQNSLIKWVVDQGFTLFVVSWKNPDASYADFGMDDYIKEGYLEAIARSRRSPARTRSTPWATALRAPRCR
jgi:polyhydroxyalkanoate synthase subunit PhaC